MPHNGRIVKHNNTNPDVNKGRMPKKDHYSRTYIGGMLSRAHDKNVRMQSKRQRPSSYENPQPSSSGNSVSRHTQTKITNKVESVHGTIRRHSYSVDIFPKNAHAKKSLGFWRLKDQTGGLINSGEGVQGVNVINFMGTPNQMVTSSGTGYNPQFQAVNSLFDANPFQTNTGGTMYGSVVAPLDDRITLDYYKLHLRIANLTTGSSVVAKVYLLKYKVNSSLSPDTIWYHCDQNMALGKAAATLPVIATPQPTGGWPNISYIDEVPESNKEFLKQVKILRKDTYELAPGANVENSYTLHYNKMIDKGTIVDAPSTYLGGWTTCIMILQYGVVGKTSTGPSVSLCPTELGVLWTRSTQCHVTEANRLKTEFVNSRIITNDTTNPSTINVVDNIAAVANA